MAAPNLIGDDASDTVETRFGIVTLADDVREATTTMSMPMANLLNPLTGLPSVGPLSILVDDVGGIVNSYRRAPHEWPVTSELALELSPDTLALVGANPDLPVVASAWGQGAKGSSALSLCTLTHGRTVIGCGTVRSFYVPMPARLPGHRTDTVVRTSTTTLAELMAIRLPPRAAGDPTLGQLADPLLVNAVGSLHGGIATAGLELVASAAVNAERATNPRHTASLRVNFLRPFVAAGTAHYVGSAVRLGRQTAVADARAIGDDGRVCLLARLTGYR